MQIASERQGREERGGIGPDIMIRDRFKSSFNYLKSFFN